MHSSIEDFIDYIYSFYNVVDGLYPVYGCTKSKIKDAIHEYWRQLQEDTIHVISTWGHESEMS